MKISIMSRRALEKLSERGLPRGTASLFLIHKVSEIFNSVEGCDVAVVGCVGVLVTRAADDDEVVAVDVHNGIMP